MKVIYDIFPARVRVIPEKKLDPEKLATCTILDRIDGSRLVDATRVVLTDDTVMIAADSPRGPMLIFRERYSKETKTQVNGVTRLITDSGKMLVFQKDSSCGCGSRLRGWNPYTTLEA